VDEGDCLFRLGLVELCLEERAPMILLGLVSLTGSQKVGGSNPPSSTSKAKAANSTSNYLSTIHSSNTQLAIPLHRLIAGCIRCIISAKSDDG
jgi:hypothetical protein